MTLASFQAENPLLSILCSWASGEDPDFYFWPGYELDKFFFAFSLTPEKPKHDECVSVPQITAKQGLISAAFPRGLSSTFPSTSPRRKSLQLAPCTQTESYIGAAKKGADGCRAMGWLVLSRQRSQHHFAQGPGCTRIARWWRGQQLSLPGLSGAGYLWLGLQTHRPRRDNPADP